jgi:hypothetical protein
MMETGWIKGRKAICIYLGVTWITVRKWRRFYGLPIHTSPGGKPLALYHELDSWLIHFNENRENLKKQDLVS